MKKRLLKLSISSGLVAVVVCAASVYACNAATGTSSYIQIYNNTLHNLFLQINVQQGDQKVGEKQVASHCKLDGFSGRCIAPFVPATLSACAHSGQGTQGIITLVQYLPNTATPVISNISYHSSTKNNNAVGQVMLDRNGYCTSQPTAYGNVKYQCTIDP